MQTNDSNSNPHDDIIIPWGSKLIVRDNTLTLHRWTSLVYFALFFAVISLFCCCYLVLSDCIINIKIILVLIILSCNALLFYASYRRKLPLFDFDKQLFYPKGLKYPELAIPFSELRHLELVSKKVKSQAGNAVVSAVSVSLIDALEPDHSYEYELNVYVNNGECHKFLHEKDKDIILEETAVVKKLLRLPVLDAEKQPHINFMNNDTQAPPADSSLQQSSDELQNTCQADGNIVKGRIINDGVVNHSERLDFKDDYIVTKSSAGKSVLIEFFRFFIPLFLLFVFYCHKNNASSLYNESINSFRIGMTLFLAFISFVIALISSTKDESTECPFFNLSSRMFYPKGDDYFSNCLPFSELGNLEIMTRKHQSKEVFVLNVITRKGERFNVLYYHLTMDAMLEDARRLSKVLNIPLMDSNGYRR